MKSPDIASQATSRQLSWQAEELIAEFEQSLRNHTNFDLKTRLASIPRENQPRLVAEIACIDLEHAFTSGNAPDISPYLSNYADVFVELELRSEVAREHYRLLRQHNAPVDPKSIADKYQVDSSAWMELPLGSDSSMNCPFPQTGSLFCDYPLIAELGEGAMGRVYLARQPDLAGRLVVLKVTRHLTTEASELAKLQHSGIIPVYSVHQQSGLFAICMPYLGAVTLAHLMRDSRVFRSSKCEDSDKCKQLASTLVSSRLSMIASTVRVSSSAAGTQQTEFTQFPNEPWIETSRSMDLSCQDPIASPLNYEHASLTEPDETLLCGQQSIRHLLGLDELADSLCQNILSRPPLEAKVDLMLDIVRAVAHAHRRNLVHSDLKPENILIANDGHPVLLDFNLAQSRLSRTSIGGGTIPYMSAQHLQTLQSTVPPLPTNDVFSLGVIFYQLLTGRLPYPGNDVGHLEKLINDRRNPATRVQTLDRTVPSSLSAIVHKCLAFAAEDRYPSAEQMEEDLQRYAKHFPLRHAPDRSWYERGRKMMRRHPLLTSNLSLISIATVLVMLLAFAWNSSQRKWERLEASREIRTALIDLPETLAMLQSPGVEPELLNRGLKSGRELLEKVKFEITGRGPFSIGKLDYLAPKEQSEIADQLGSLLYSMAGAELQLATADSHVDKSTIERAEEWNRLAGKVSPKLDLPVQFQAEYIRNMQQGQNPVVSSSDFNASAKGASTYAKMLAAHQSDLIEEWVALSDQWVGESPTDPGRWFSLASAKLAQGELQSALSSMDVAVRLQPESMTAIFWRGVFRLKATDFDGAKRDFTTCVLKQEDLMSARYNRALANNSLGDYKAALEDLNWIVDHKQATTRVFSLRSQLYVALNDSARAKSDLQTAIESTPLSPEDWVARGVLKIQSAPKNALADFQQALKLDSNNSAAHFNSAHVYSEILGDLPAAINSLTELEKLGKKNASVIASRGILLARNDQDDLAIQDANSAAALQPNPLEMLQIAGIFSLVATSESELGFAATWLSRSIAADKTMAELAVQDPDLIKLRQSPKFSQVLGN